MQLRIQLCTVASIHLIMIDQPYPRNRHILICIAGAIGTTSGTVIRAAILIAAAFVLNMFALKQPLHTPTWVGSDDHSTAVLVCVVAFAS